MNDESHYLLIKMQRDIFLGKQNWLKEKKVSSKKLTGKISVTCKIFTVWKVSKHSYLCSVFPYFRTE